MPEEGEPLLIRQDAHRSGVAAWCPRVVLLAPSCGGTGGRSGPVGTGCANPAVRKRSLRVTCLPCRCRGVSKVAVPSRSDSLPVRDPRMRDRRWNERQSSRAPGVGVWRLSWLGAGRPCCGSTGPGAVVRLGRRSRSRRLCRRVGRTGQPGAGFRARRRAARDADDMTHPARLA
jgi:hypothetical protein